MYHSGVYICDFFQCSGIMVSVRGKTSDEGTLDIASVAVRPQGGPRCYQLLR